MTSTLPAAATLRSPSVTTSGFVSRSHKAIAPFVLVEPDDPAHAAKLIAEGAVPHAGGIDVVARLRNGTAAHTVVRLDRLDDLRRIEVDGDRLLIGAGVTHSAVETNPTIAELRPDLAAAWRTVGNLRIRRTGTLGGNLMSFDPSYDTAPILAAADALLRYVNPDGSTTEHTVAERPSNGLLAQVSVPTSGLVVFDRSLKPTVSVAVGDDTIAIGCAYPSVLTRARTGFDAGSLPDPVDDAFSSATHRRRMIDVLVQRCSVEHDRGSAAR